MACIFCLDDNPETIIYKGICNCHPHIHIECINNWFKINPSTCPICHIKYEIVIERSIKYKRYVCGFLYLVCCLSICCWPIIIICILMTLPYRGNQLQYNTTGY